MSNFKKVFKTVCLLVSITCLFGVLVASIYKLLNPKIEDNYAKMEEELLNSLYKDYNFRKIEAIDDSVDKIYEVLENDIVVAYVYTITGKNSYGVITLMVGVNLNNEIEKVEIIKNTQSYAAFSNKHINETYKNNVLGNEEVNNVDIKCGATHSARLVKEMMLSVLEYHKDRFKND